MILRFAMWLSDNRVRTCRYVRKTLISVMQLLFMVRPSLLWQLWVAPSLLSAQAACLQTHRIWAGAASSSAACLLKSACGAPGRSHQHRTQRSCSC